MANPKVLLNYIYGNFGVKIQNLLAYILLRKVYKNSYKVDKVLTNKAWKGRAW